MDLGFSGNVNIKTYDDNKNLVSEVYADNTVLDYVTPTLDAVIGVINEDDVTVPSTTLSDLAKTFLGTNVLINPATFGMVAYKNVKVAPSIISTSHEKPCVCAGATTVATSVLGSLNTALSKALTNTLGDTIGYSFVWDFAAGTEVSNINSICLTTRSIASQVSPIALTGTAEIFNHYDYGSKRKNLTFSKKGQMITSIENSASCRKDKKIRLTATGISFAAFPSDIEALVSIVGYVDCFKIIDSDTENLYITIAKNLATGNRELIKIDKTTKVIVSTTVISCINSTIFYDWGLCGHFIVILTTTGGTSPIAKSVDLLTNTLGTLTLPNAAGSNSGNQTISTYTTIEGSYCCDINYSTDNYSPYYPRFVEVYQKADASGLEFTDYNISGTTRDFWMPNQSFGCLPISWIVDTGYLSGARLRQYLGFARRAIFSVCNLGAPVTKTVSQTMQITYNLYWGPND